jgi:quercetin dioxygenase-like cupin family protein
MTMRLERIPWQGAGAPVERILKQRLAAEGFDVSRWRDEPGAEYRPHSHDHDESLWVVEGEIVFGIGGREYRLGAGDRLMLPAGTVHTARAGAGGATYLIGERAVISPR